MDVHLFDGLAVADAERLWADLLEMIHAVEELPCPTVFAAHALCLTAAFELSLACDLLLAAESARFGLVETVVGLTPAMGGTQRLADRAGPARARELVMTGGLFDAATLERWNVVNRVLPDAGFDAAARALRPRPGRGPDARPRRHEAPRPGAGRRRLPGRRRARARRWRAPCSGPRTSAARCGRSSSADRATRPMKDARAMAPGQERRAPERNSPVRKGLTP